VRLRASQAQRPVGTERTDVLESQPDEVLANAGEAGVTGVDQPVAGGDETQQKGAGVVVGGGPSRVLHRRYDICSQGGGFGWRTRWRTALRSIVPQTRYSPS